MVATYKVCRRELWFLKHAGLASVLPALLKSGVKSRKSSWVRDHLMADRMFSRMKTRVNKTAALWRGTRCWAVVSRAVDFSTKFLVFLFPHFSLVSVCSWEASLIYSSAPPWVSPKKSHFRFRVSFRTFSSFSLAFFTMATRPTTLSLSLSARSVYFRVQLQH